jgi:hypothetical protein
MDLGHQVDGFVRNPKKGADLAKSGISSTVGDIVKMSVSEIASALSGSDAIVFSAGAGGRDSAEATKQVDGDGPLKLAAAAKDAKVERFVLVSVFPEAWRERGSWGCSLCGFPGAANDRKPIRVSRTGRSFAIARLEFGSRSSAPCGERVSANTCSTPMVHIASNALSGLGLVKRVATCELGPSALNLVSKLTWNAPFAAEPFNTTRILSSAERCRRAARRMSLIAFSAGSFSGPDFCRSLRLK